MLIQETQLKLFLQGGYKHELPLTPYLKCQKHFTHGNLCEYFMQQIVIIIFETSGEKTFY